MGPLRALALLALIVVASVAPAWAQDQAEEVEPADGRVLFVVGEIEYELDPSVAVNACIMAENEDLIRDEHSVVLQIFVRTTEPDGFQPMGAQETPLTPELGEHPTGYCVPLGEIDD